MERHPQSFQALQWHKNLQESLLVIKLLLLLRLPLLLINDGMDNFHRVLDVRLRRHVEVFLLPGDGP